MLIPVFIHFFPEHLLSSPKTKLGVGERPPFQVQLKPLDGSALDPPRPLTAPNRKAIKQLLLSTNDNSNNRLYSNNNSGSSIINSSSSIINNTTAANVDTITAGTTTGSTTMNRVNPSKRAMSANTSTTTATTRTRQQSKSSVRPNSVSSLRPTSTNSTTPTTTTPTTTRKHNSTIESENQTTADVSITKQNLSTITIDKQQHQLQQQQIQQPSQQKQQLQETDEECGFQADSTKSPEVELGFDPRRPSVFAASMQSTKLELLRRKSSIDATLAALTLSPSIGSTSTGNGGSKKIIQRNNSGSGRYPSGQLLRKLSKNEKSNSTNSSNSNKLCIQVKTDDNHSIGNSNSLTSSRVGSNSTLPSIEHI